MMRFGASGDKHRSIWLIIFMMMVMLFNLLGVANAAAPAVPVTWVALQQTVNGTVVPETSLDIAASNTEGEATTGTLVATVFPANATNQTVTWASSNTGVAKISPNGLTCVVTGVSPGIANVTVTAVDMTYGTLQATCAVIVNLGQTSGCTAPGLTIKSGYTGGQYTILHTFSATDLANPNNFNQTPDMYYTYIDSMQGPDIEAAQGVKLSDILSSVGISSVSNVSSFSFYAEDRGLYSTLAESYLYPSAGRYYFPNMPANFDYNLKLADGNTGGVDPSKLSAAEAGAVQVYPIIDEQEYFSLDVTSSPPYSSMSNIGCPRLSFGEEYTDIANSVVTASRSVKWVYEIDATLNGTPVTGVSLTKSGDIITAGNTDRLAATVAPNNATNQSVTWTSSNTSVAKVDQNGNVTAVTPGTATIAATTADGSFFAICPVTVQPAPVPVTGVSLNKASDTINAGNTDSLTATVAPNNATNQSVTWTSDNTTVATVGSTTGVVTPVADGTAVITATTADGGFTATCDVTVTGEATSGPTTFMTIKVNGTPFTVTDAQILALNPTNTLSYFSSNNGPFTILGAPFAQILSTYTSLTSSEAKSVSANFIGSDSYQASVPESTLTATRYYYPSTGGQVQVVPMIAVQEDDAYTTDPTQLCSSECLRNLYGQTPDDMSTASNFCKNIEEIDVTYVPVSTISLKQYAYTINLGSTYTLTATVSPNNATNPTVTWNSSNTAVATVNPSTGVVTPVSPGTANITATAADGSNTVSEPCVVTVLTPAVLDSTISLNQPAYTINEGGTYTLTATVSPNNATDQTVTWSSSNTAVATVNPSTGVVTAVGPGTANIIAAATDGSGTVSAPCVVTVPQPSTSVTGVTLNNASGTLTNDTDTIDYGNTDTLVATVIPSTAVNKTVTWSSDNTAVATVGATTGVVTPVHWGTANVTATTQDGGYTATCAVTVIGGPTTSMVITVNGGAPVTVTAAQITSLSSGNLVDYSATSSGGSQMYFTAEGAPFAEILTTYAGVPSSEVQDVTATFIGSDNFTVTVDPSEFNTRYYFPSGSTVGVPVVPFIATEEADNITTDPTQLSPSDCLRNFYGQASSTEHTSMNLDKGLKEIDVTYPIPAPTVSGVSPTSGSTAGGEAVTITGAGFTGATAVNFGTVAVTSSNFTVNGDTSITVTAPAESAGTVNVTVTTPGGTSATSTADQFSYTAPTYILGDVNGDGKVNLTDALMIAKYYMHQISLTSTQLAAADVNGDGRVNLTDALMIAKYYMHQISSL